MWITNNIYAPFTYNQTKLILIWLCFSTALLFLCHSIIIHKHHRHKIRTFSELVYIMTIINCIMLHISGTYPGSKTTVAICQNLITYGFLSCGIQALDNYFVYTLYFAATKVPLWERCVIHIYIWLTVLCFLPFVTLVPFFVDLNTNLGIQMYTILGSYCWSALYLSYNFYFGWKIWFIIQKRFFLANRMNSVTMLSYRNILHLFFV